MSQSTERTCPNGHKYQKSSDCQTCPVCESQREPGAEYMRIVSAPARRALERAGILSLEVLSGWTERDLAALHGMGPNAIGKLKAALEERGLSLKGVN